MQTKLVTTINSVNIVISNDNQQLIPIRPICEALGIDYSSQIQKIKEDDFLSSVVVLSPTTGRDGKQYEMVCLPLKYVYGWLFTINPKNVAPDAYEAVCSYRLECYNALYDHFNGTQRKVIEQNQIEIKLLEEIAEYSQEIHTAKQNLTERKRKLQQIRDARLNSEQTLF